jgi:ParB family chromosome partitioning protein
MTLDEQHPPGTTTLPLSRIVSGNNPRRYFAQDKHDEMVSSIRSRGVLQPLLLRPAAEPDKYEIVAGERRYRAALVVFGADGAVPVLIREMTDQEALEAAIDENDIREDASETEQADAAVRVLAACGDDRAEAARRLGWSTAKLDRRLALANLSDAVKLALDERRIKVGHAELLAVVPADKQDKALETIVTAGIDVAKTRELLMHMTQSLAAASFDKSECTSCPFNSATQRALFETHVDEGNCTNPGCYQLKTEAAQAEREALTKSGEAGGETNPAAMPGAARPSTPDSSPDPSPDQGSDPAGNAKVPTKPAPPAASTKKPVVSTQSLASRVKDQREAAWRAALVRDLAGHRPIRVQDVSGDSRDSQLVVLVAAMSASRPLPVKTLADLSRVLLGETFTELDRAGRAAVIRDVPGGRVTNALYALAAAYVRDAINFDHVAELALAFEIDLRETWQVDAAFLARFGKDELKFIAKECGLIAHMGEKAFAKLLKSAVPGIVAGMIHAQGFTWEGRLPSAMTLDGEYGPPPEPAPFAPAEKVAAPC